MAEKVRLLIDGVEIPGLVSTEEISYEEGTIEVPEFKKIRVIKNGVKKIPLLNCKYKIQRDSQTLKMLRDWFENDETHEITKIRTDAHGNEFARTLFTQCDSAKYSEPAFDGANPTYAQVNCLFVPYDMIMMS